MRARIYQVDAFTSRRFAGNPAAVCLLDGWPEDDLLQAVAAENNLSETAFLVPAAEEYELRWFTPEAEVELCGHATLASAHVLLRIREATRDSVRFRTARGTLEVVQEGEVLTMDFPAVPGEPVEAPPTLAEGLGAEPASVLGADDWLAVFPTPEQVTALEPDMGALRGLDRRGVIATAPAAGGGSGGASSNGGGDGGDEGGGSSGPSPEAGEASFGAPDFVSRFFAPKVGVPEDPVTGSAHCTLAPYWSDRLGKDVTVGRQISRRGGEVRCEVRGDRVALSGRAVLYLEGWIRI